MKLQKCVSRKSKGKAYEKWFVNMPSETVVELGWKAGDDIEFKSINGELLLRVKDKNKVQIKVPKNQQLTYFERFAVVYGNLPPTERKLPIIVIDGEEFSWYRCYSEMKKRNALGERIGKRLLELRII